MTGVDLPLFDEVAEVLRGLAPRDLGTLRCRPRRYGIKAWFGGDRPTREHYEAQIVAPDAVEGAHVLALEIGFHAEHPEVSDNDAALAGLAGHERRWRRVLGAAAVAGPFLGRADVWRRLSETWADPDLDDADLPLEIGTRLVDYIAVLEPLRRDRGRIDAAGRVR